MRNINEYNNYHATMCGKIFNINTKKELKPNKTRTNYHIVRLYKNGKQKCFLIHRLVCLAYKFYTDESRKDVNHIDGDKTNNKINNLQWCSKSENMIHALETKLLVPKRKGENHNAKQVLNMFNGVFYDSIIEYCDSINIKYYQLQSDLKYNKNKHNLTII